MRAFAAALVLWSIGCNALIGLDDGQPANGAGGHAASSVASSAASSSSSAKSSSSSGEICGMSATCEPQPGDAWLGPFVLLSGQVTCPPLTGASTEVVVKEEVQPLGCACTCSPSSKSCTAKIRLSQQQGCVGSIGTVSVSASGGCHNLPGFSATAVSVDTSSNPQCSSSIDLMLPPLPTRTACFGTIASCGTSSTCVPHAPGALVCIAPMDPNKALPCPPAYAMSVTSIAAMGLMDTRACTSLGACTCTPGPGIDCSGDVKVFEDNACKLPLVDVPIPPSGHSNCYGFLAGSAGTATYDPISLGTCTPMGKESPTGSVDGTKTSLCCHD